MAWRAPAGAQSAAGSVRRQARSGECNGCARPLQHPLWSSFDKWRESCHSRDVIARFSLLLLPLAGACGATLPQPLQAAPPEDAFVEVPYPPPAALSAPTSPAPPCATPISVALTQRARFLEADMTGANLSGCDLTDAELEV